METRQDHERNEKARNEKTRLDLKNDVNRYIELLKLELKFLDCLIDMIKRKSTHLKELNKLTNKLLPQDPTISVTEQIELFKYLPDIIHGANRSEILNKLIDLRTGKEKDYDQQKFDLSKQASGRIAGSSQARTINKQLYENKLDEIENRKMESAENSLSVTNSNVISAVYQALQINTLLGMEPTRYEEKENVKWSTKFDHAKNEFLGLFSKNSKKKNKKEAYQLFSEDDTVSNVNEKNESSEQVLKSSLSK